MSSIPLLHQRFPELRETLPHVSLGTGPTPLTQLGAWARPDRGPVWMKDEGTYGDGGWGGNKVRKLEWLLPDVQRLGRRTILTVGGLGTNWGLATALYARDYGIETALALIDQPVDEHVQAQLERLERSGATLHFTGTKARTIIRVPRLLARHSTGLRLPYLLPAGGSSPLGAVGYVETALELGEQVRAGVMPEPSHIVTAVGSGGTAAGLLLGLKLAGLKTRVVGVVVNDTLRLDTTTLLRLARKTERLLRARGAPLPHLGLTSDDLIVTRERMGPGYGVATPEGAAAQAQASEHEGLALDPVYTAKAMAGLMAMANGTADPKPGAALSDAPVVFLQTNGPR